MFQMRHRNSSFPVLAKTCVVFIIIFIMGLYYINVVRTPAGLYPIKQCIYNVTPVIRPTCQPNEQMVCKRLGEVTIYSPCFSSTLLDSKVACHDSFSCDKETSKRTEPKSSTNFSRRAFFSALYTDDQFLDGALILGYTIKKHHPHYPMYILYLNSMLSNRTLCSLRQVGWIPLVVQNIPPPLKGTWSHFINQFTKLTLWNMTQFDSIIYLDSDNLVLDDIAHLHELVADPSRTRFEFAAVADNWHGKFAYHFNAGVLVLHPSAAVFNELIRTMSLPGNYEPTMAEQAFLNAFFQLRYLQLPLIYNVNLAMYSAYPDLWKQLQSDFKIVHFTLVKPFLNQSNKAYDFPLQLYHHAWHEYRKSKWASQVEAICMK